MRQLLHSLKHMPLSQQLALTAAVCCLVATLALVALSVKSSRFTQENLQQEYGAAVAEQVAQRVSMELSAGDLLGVASELGRLIEQQGITSAVALDVEGTELAAAGARQASDQVYAAAITIAGDTAGSVEVAVNTRAQDAAQQQLLAALVGLSVVLSFFVFGITRAMAHRLASNIDSLSAELGEVTGHEAASNNEVAALRERVSALPLDLLRFRSPSEGQASHYSDTGILFIYFRSLAGYVETIDERRLQRYVATVHRLIYGAAGFYGGEIYVVRQFGIAVFFSGAHPVGSPALRAASTAWLIRHATADTEARLRLSVTLGLAVGASELGRGDAQDIYPGLYTQSALDDLLALANAPGSDILIAPSVASDVDLTTRAALDTTDAEHLTLGELAGGQRDLLERQLRLLLKALSDQTKNDAEDQSA